VQPGICFGRQMKKDDSLVVIEFCSVNLIVKRIIWIEKTIHEFFDRKMFVIEGVKSTGGSVKEVKRELERAAI
jgi:hypothetical protein